VRTLAQLKSASVSNRAQTALMSTFSTVAVILAAVGMYGVLAYSVALRRREIGIRAGFGASSSRLLRAVVGPGVGRHANRPDGQHHGRPGARATPRFSALQRADARSVLDDARRDDSCPRRAARVGHSRAPGCQHRPCRCPACGLIQRGGQHDASARPSPGNRSTRRRLSDPPHSTAAAQIAPAAVGRKPM
jgi:hypothetical protein